MQNINSLFKFILVIFLILFSRATKADSYPNYASSLINKDLLSKADVVIRDKTIHVTWKEIDKVIVRKNMAVTIMNKEGMSHTLFYETYNNSRKISQLHVIVLDKFGNEIKNYKKSAFKDRAIVSGLYSDNRYKSIKPISNSFPFTVIFLVEVIVSNSIYFPSWEPSNSSYTAIEKSKYTFSNPKGFQYRINQQNILAKINNRGDLIWSIENFKANSPESFSTFKNKYLPYVEISPVNFIYEGIEGKFTDWKEYGYWFYNEIIKNQNNLTPQQKFEILKLIDDDDTDIVKARKVYAHLQEKMRYVSVQVGIGGIQPISAQEVAECGYGDCKGLTNYTKSALEVVGIESIYTEVKSGKKKYSYYENFASVTQGDHIILCLPNIAKDTIWLECTSKDTPFGYLGNFTDDRNVLLITPEGGKITKTPNYSETSNSISKNIEAIIKPIGKIEGISTSKFSGNKYLDHIFIANLSDKNKQVALSEVYSNNMQINSVSYIETDSLINTEIIDFFLPNNNVLISDKSFVFNPYLLKNKKIKLYRNRNRKSDIAIYRTHIESDSISFQLPKHSKVESLPSSIVINSDFGSYVRLVSKKENSIIYYRKFTLKEGYHSKDKYKEFYMFIRKVNRADNSKVMMYL